MERTQKEMAQDFLDEVFILIDEEEEMGALDLWAVLDSLGCAGLEFKRGNAGGMAYIEGVSEAGEKK